MQIVKILYFASLREIVGVAETSVEMTGKISAVSLWQAANPDIALPESSLVAINQSYASLESDVNPGDEVAFFPPVTGG